MLLGVPTEEKLYLEFCVYLAFEDDDKPESFEFLFVKENIFFFLESRESTNGILVKPTFSNESELNIELIKENEIVGKSEEYYSYQLSKEQVNFGEIKEPYLIIKKLE